MADATLDQQRRDAAFKRVRQLLCGLHYCVRRRDCGRSDILVFENYCFRPPYRFGFWHVRIVVPVVFQ